MKYIWGLLFALVAECAFSQELPQWKEGYMDIHHINTGRGDCTFCILPDGTTLLIDAGENNRVGERVVAAKPEDTKQMDNYCGTGLPGQNVYSRTNKVFGLSLDYAF